MLDGQIEVVKVVDGIERDARAPAPGDIFGEVPITLGMPFPSGYRAVEPSRVMQIEAHDYYAIAAAAPEVAVKVGALARERIGGLQDIAAEPPQPRAYLLGAPLGPVLLRSAALPRPQPDHVRVASERRTRALAAADGDPLRRTATTLVRPSLRDGRRAARPADAARRTRSTTRS